MAEPVVPSYTQGWVVARQGGVLNASLSPHPKSRLTQHMPIKAMAYVFSGSCDSEITLEWVAENRLRVSYSIGDGVTLTKWPRTRDGAVTLEYRLIQ